MRKKIVVIGSTNIDISMIVSHIPQVGETILAKEMKRSGDGKGANQALTIAKLGGLISFISRVGDDDAGRLLYNELEAAGVNMEGVILDERHHTGTASIYVSDSGDNNIVVFPGANFAIDKYQIDRYRSLITEADYCVMQLEIPFDIVEYVVDICEEAGVSVILNPAPAKKLSPALIKKVSYIVPNETELHLITNSNESVEAQAKYLLKLGVANVIVTRGSLGSIIVNEKGFDMIPPNKVDAIDTTAAGDSYIGGLVVALCEGKSISEAIRFATCVAGIVVTRHGAYDSIPDRREVDEEMHRIN